jgi:hypothetical protein
MKKMSICDDCAFYNEDDRDQPCCSCLGQNFEEADNESQTN